MTLMKQTQLKSKVINYSIFTVANDKETNTVLEQHLDEEEPQILSTTLPERLYQEG